jgi:hypothetical protein
MAYVSKDGNGNINGVYGSAQPDALDGNGNVVCQGVPTVVIADNDPSVIAFLNPVRPDVKNFIQDCKAAVGGIQGTLTLAAYAGILFDALGTGNWSDAQTVIIAAHTGGALTDAQYSAIKTAAGNRNIPIQL